MSEKRSSFGSIIPVRTKKGGYYAEFRKNGIVYSSHKWFRNKSEARKWLIDQEAALSAGTWKSPDQLQAEAQREERAKRDRELHTVDFVFRQLAASPKWKDSTRTSETKRYEAHIKPVFGDMPITDVTHQAVAAWLTGIEFKEQANRKPRPGRKPKPKPASPQLKKKLHALMRRIINYAIDREYLETDPRINREYIRDIFEMTDQQKQQQRERHEAKYRTVEEIKALLDEVPEYCRITWALIAVAGLRVSEARPLKRRDIDFKQGTLHITHVAVGEGKYEDIRPGTKSAASRRIIPLDPRVLKLVSEHCERFGIWRSNDYLVRSATKPTECIPYGTMKSQGYAISRRHNFPSKITPHDLRHTAATLSARVPGISLADQAAYLGHEGGYTITEHYQHADIENLQKIAAFLADQYLGAPGSNVVKLPALAANA